MTNLDQRYLDDDQVATFVRVRTRRGQAERRAFRRWLMRSVAHRRSTGSGGLISCVGRPVIRAHSTERSRAGR